MTGFRLAMVAGADGAAPMVEQGGCLLPLGDLLPEVAPSDDLLHLLDGWGTWRDLLSERVAAAGSRFAEAGRPAAAVRFLPPVRRPGKLVCIGTNYHDHIAEMPIPVQPTYPFAFLKPPNTTLRGSGEAVAAPANVAMFDWEAELAVVIGARVRDLPVARALEAVAGYANFNDLSARDWIASRPAIGIDWVRHKCFDGFAPFGPFLVPAADVGDPQALPVRLAVNGVVKQQSSTAQMIFGVAEIIAYLSSIMTLEPGDVIATGTPAGVGHGRRPPEYLQPGDEVAVEIGPLGRLATPIVAPRVGGTGG